jgi:hypothetical protein
MTDSNVVSIRAANVEKNLEAIMEAVKLITANVGVVLRLTGTENATFLIVDETTGKATHEITVQCLEPKS